jgi:hypothetical protein
VQQRLQQRGEMLDLAQLARHSRARPTIRIGNPEVLQPRGGAGQDVILGPVVLPPRRRHEIRLCGQGAKARAAAGIRFELMVPGGGEEVRVEELRTEQAGEQVRGLGRRQVAGYLAGGGRRRAAGRAARIGSSG